MKPVEFSSQEKEILVAKVKQYFAAELNQDIGQFDAEFLIDFFSLNVGGYYYNRGLSDAQLAIRSKLDDIEMEIESLEKVTEFVK
ncbi:DUF2164 domain-containing protein [Arenicella xantha]|uniref:Uncharacterized protein (DUF2164 family) n=1 Tax=Arenicella xantha TaxID=644221 RepID=A0A395JT53_9GAMM|nr:DUF2164 domain-containing protein [Arenicella xantha]RBP52738.1 uncharacterized protein (DUF2164 family) [Arenicella xantha]